MPTTRWAVLVAAATSTAVLFASCGGGDSGPSSGSTANCDQGKKNELQDGLVTIDLRCGSGAPVTTGQVAVVTYVGELDNGKTFDSTQKEGGRPLPVQLGAGRVIPGWDLGVPGMAVGGTRKLIIPPGLAYGKQGYPGVIPKNARLTFSVTLKDIKG